LGLDVFGEMVDEAKLTEFSYIQLIGFSLFRVERGVLEACDKVA
jgi:hypothetical protein